MKTPIHLLAFLTVAATAAEPVAPAKTAAYQGSVSEDQLRVATQRLKDEMSALVDEYGQYASASGEVGQIKEAVGTLDGVAAKDMSGVVQTLLEASRGNDPKVLNDQLRQASRNQKQIQVVLRELADKLTRHAATAALQKRLEDIAVRQATVLRTTKEMAAKANSPKELPEKEKQDLNEKRWEQQALEKEVRMAVEELKKAAKNPEKEGAKEAAQALAAANEKQLEERSKQAANAMENELPRAVETQQQMMDALKSMISNLDETKTAEERNRELAGQLEELSQKEQSLAAQTPKIQEWDQKNARRQQEEVSSRLEVMKDRVEKLNPEAGAKTAESAAKANEISKQLQTEKFNQDTNRVANTADAQKNLSKELAAMGESFQKQADSLAQNGESQDEKSESGEMSAEEAAIQEAMNDLVEAKEDIELAQLQNRQGQNVKDRTGQAQQKIDAARAQAEKAGKAAGDQVAKRLSEAGENARKAGNGEEVEGNLYRARDRLNDAMGALQQAANQLASNAKQPDDPNQRRNAGTGMGRFKTGSQTTNVDAAGKASDAQRDALTLLKQEKVAPEYQPMVDQYIKNLAEEADQ